MNMFVDPSAVYLHRDFVNFRKAINSLAALVEDELNRDAYTGALFVFCNKAKDKLKILYWDKTGFALWQKRLEKQKFKWPSKSDDTEFLLIAEQLSWLLSGYDVLGHQELHYHTRYLAFSSSQRSLTQALVFITVKSSIRLIFFVKIIG
jgi:transposase